MSTELKFLRGLSLAGGLLLACLALAQLVVPLLASLQPENADGKSLMAAAFIGAGFTALFALPLLAWPFRPRAARWFMGALLCAIVALLINHVFRSNHGNPAYRVMAVTMGLLALLRIWLAWRPRPAAIASADTNCPTPPEAA